MDRLRRLRSLPNAVTVNEFRAIMVTDSVRPTTIQVIHYGEEAIREVFSCSKWLRNIRVFPAMIWQQNTNLYFILRERLDWRNLHALWASSESRSFFHIWTFSVLARFLYLCVYLFIYLFFCFVFLPNFFFLARCM